MNEIRPMQTRRFRRTRVFLKATLERHGASLPVLLRNLSREGALVQGDDLPEEGARVLLHRQGLSVPSRVIWSNRGRAGLEFDYPLFPRELLRYVPPLPVSSEDRPGLGSTPNLHKERGSAEKWSVEDLSQSRQ